MSLQQLRYLLALDDLRHFSLAAKHCFVAQPTLTTQLKKLEDELGVQLIDRKANPLRPTPIGEKVIAQARIILEDVAGLEALLREETGSLAGTYVLGIIPTLAPYLLPLFLQSFTSRFPDVHLVIREMQSEEIMEGLKRGKVDLGLLVTPLEDKQLREIILFYEPLQVYAAPNEPILDKTPLLPEHVNQEELWIMEQGHCFRNQVLNICNFKSDSPSPDRAITFQAGSIETLKNMVRNNLGYTIVPEMSVHPNLDKDYVKSFADPQPAREVSLVVSKAFSREQLIAELRKAILAVVPDRFRKNERYVGIAWR
ncbi:hydrogen peroxide-inducible genes activator [Neolewinella aurantiaca]|uniref:Hydrogen peroxide-inducible genes activator n=1 Tax=Neolewinella aurantiaca TaxID=2602767 RepID=A0A5C7FGM7_9BACT|nr:hydrogen peroxide-inducible genes activator [Neolewinella aurantiaca]TXF90130.1 hydrogen peroxide-inducible genes activator [Neolewinella aurantiaca]